MNEEVSNSFPPPPLSGTLWYVVLFQVFLLTPIHICDLPQSSVRPPFPSVIQRFYGCPQTTAVARPRLVCGQTITGLRHYFYFLQYYNSIHALEAMHISLQRSLLSLILIFDAKIARCLVRVPDWFNSAVWSSSSSDSYGLRTWTINTGFKWPLLTPKDSKEIRNGVGSRGVGGCREYAAQIREPMTEDYRPSSTAVGDWPGGIPKSLYAWEGVISHKGFLNAQVRSEENPCMR